jgi:signal transduction histidine kinase
VIYVDAHRTCDGRHLVMVEDTGTGMTADVFERLGVLYCSSRIGGSGLGVALAAEVARRHGGALSFETVPRAGTRAIVSLPSLSECAASGA